MQIPSCQYCRHFGFCKDPARCRGQRQVNVLVMEALGTAVTVSVLALVVFVVRHWL